MTKETKPFYLIDASSYIYRAFYGMRSLTSPQGLPTHAVYGFARMLLKVLKDRQPDYVCVVFDSPGPTFRHRIYPEYKATRQVMPEDLALQIPYIKELVAGYRLPMLELEGYEADDLIATLATRARSEELMPVMIVSGDKDLHQLIEDPWVLQWDAQRERLFSSSEVRRRLGVEPAQVVDYLALTGDASDHVPGVPGIGPKTAVKLLKQWGSLDDIYAHLDEIKAPSLKKKVRDHRDLAYLSRDLVTLKRDAPVASDPQRYRFRSPDWPRLAALFEELGFRRFLDEMDRSGATAKGVAGSAPTREQPRRRDHIVVTMEEFDRLVQAMKRSEGVSIDLETTSPDPMRAEIVGIAICFKDHEAYYVPVAHRGEGSDNQLDRTRVLDRLKGLLGAQKPQKIGQNIKYELIVFSRHQAPFHGLGFDTMIASYLLEPGQHAHGLERIAAAYLGEEMISYQEVTGKGKKQVNFAEVAVDRAARYACEDAEITWRLVPLLRRRLEQEQLLDLYRALEMPLVPVLARMEQRGILVDAQHLETISLDLEKQLEREVAEIYRLAGKKFNVQSPKQLAQVLFEDLGLPVVKRTKTGPSTDMSVLERLAAEHPIADHLLAYRSLAKLKGTYVDALPRLIHPQTGRIHTSFNQTVTATGRLSSSDPNLQNIPVRTGEGKRIREAFVAPPGMLLLSADYSQIELRVLAHYSQDENLLAAFREDADVHRRTAAEVFGVAPQAVSPEMRRQAKAINFGIIYGMGPYGLARQLRISSKSAKAAIERYFERYRGVRRFIEATIEKAREQGYSQTLLGRKRAIPELGSRNQTIRRQGERLAVNTTVQGTAADLIKKAMIDIDRAMGSDDSRCAMLLQVHDELVFEVAREELETVKALVREKMEGVWPLTVPLKVDLGWGANWAEAH